MSSFTTSVAFSQCFLSRAFIYFCRCDKYHKNILFFIVAKRNGKDFIVEFSGAGMGTFVDFVWLQKFVLFRAMLDNDMSPVLCIYYMLSLHLQLIAVEALVHATSKKDKCVGIVDTAIPILKQLYKESTSDNIRVRSLVVSFTNILVIWWELKVF